jgi:predicted DNA binding CopG/RHH family protein
MKKKMRRSEMYLTEKQHDTIKEEAENRGINFSEMMRKIIDYYLERKKSE